MIPGEREAFERFALQPEIGVTSAGVRWLRWGHEPDTLLLHGRGHAASMWLPLVSELRSAIAFDLPGFGLSRPGEGRGVAFFSVPVAAAIREVCPNVGTIVGHSLGGATAMDLVLRRNIAVERLVLIASMGLSGQMNASARAFFRVGPERLARWLGPERFESIAPWPADERSRALAKLEFALMTGGGGRVEAKRAFDALVPMFGPVPNEAAELCGLSTRTDVIWGSKDAAMTAARAKSATALMPNARFTELDCGHSPQHERVAEVAAILAAR